MASVLLWIDLRVSLSRFCCCPRTTDRLCVRLLTILSSCPSFPILALFCRRMRRQSCTVPCFTHDWPLSVCNPPIIVRLSFFLCKHSDMCCSSPPRSQLPRPTAFTCATSKVHTEGERLTKIQKNKQKLARSVCILFRHATRLSWCCMWSVLDSRSH